MDGAKIPAHVGIIMDGNGRWAVMRGKNRSYGHKHGSANVDRIVTHAFSCGVKALTLYAFSSENWARPKEEVDELMKLLKTYFKKFIQKVIKNDVRLIVVGERENLSKDLVKVIEDGENKSKNNSGHILNIAVNYGGRADIVHAVNALIAQGKTEVTEADITAALYTAASPAPDLIVRTGAEQRLSNFLLWEAAYAEFYFSEVLWPDFDEHQVDLAVNEFYQRKRRFGGL